MANKRRIEQINELLREEIAQILILENADPVLAALTVIEVRAAADLSSARVFVMVRKDAAGVEAGSVQNLRHAAEVVQKLLGPRIRIKKTPRLRFEVDETEERAERIEKLLQEVRKDWDDAERDS
jgi:ribosome-binding factor A